MHRIVERSKLQHGGAQFSAARLRGHTGRAIVQCTECPFPDTGVYGRLKSDLDSGILIKLLFLFDIFGT